MIYRISSKDAKLGGISEGCGMLSFFNDVEKNGIIETKLKLIFFLRDEVDVILILMNETFINSL